MKVVSCFFTVVAVEVEEKKDKSIITVLNEKFCCNNHKIMMTRQFMYNFNQNILENSCLPSHLCSILAQFSEI
jgi:hypothetical protein